MSIEELEGVLYYGGIICCCLLAFSIIVVPFFTADSYTCNWLKCEFTKYSLVNKDRCLNAEDFYQVPKGLNITSNISII